MHIRKRELTCPTYLRAAAAFAGVALTISLAGPALATSGPPIGRIYDCYSNPTGFSLYYVAALELKTSSAYLVAPYRKGNRLSGRTAKGSYKLRGSKVTFLTGPYGKLHYSGKWAPKHMTQGVMVGASLALIGSNNRPTRISCYPH